LEHRGIGKALELVDRHPTRVKAGLAHEPLELLELVLALDVPLFAGDREPPAAVRSDDWGEALAAEIAAHDQRRDLVEPGRVQELPPEQVAPVDVRRVVEAQRRVGTPPPQHRVAFAISRGFTVPQLHPVRTGRPYTSRLGGARRRTAEEPSRMRELSS